MTTKHYVATHKTSKSRSEAVKPADLGHCYWLDWLRFGAAFVVTVGHVRGGYFVEYGGLDPKDQSLLTAAAFACTRIGLESVILFFVLSGFLVGGRSAQKAGNGSFSPLTYAIDRTTRIYVPLLPALVLTSMVVWYCGGSISPWAFCGNLAGLNGIFVEDYGGNAPLWSLAYEIWFYVLWGGVLTLFTNVSSTARLAAWAAVLAGLAVFTKLEPLYLFCWLLGVLVKLADMKGPRFVRLCSSVLIIVAGVVLSQITSNSVSLNLQWFHQVLPSHSVSLLILSVGFAVLVKTVADWQPRSKWGRSLEKLGTPLSAFSYTLYLTHFSVIGLLHVLIPGRVKKLDFSSLAVFAFEVALCLLVAYFLYVPFERNTGRVRRRLQAKLGSNRTLPITESTL